MTSESQSQGPVERLLEQQSHLMDWLHNHALPLWSTAGIDKERGGFQELLDLQGHPIAANRRFRVQPRQVYCYAAAGLAGWPGPWRKAVEHGLNYFESRYLLDTGYFAATVSMDGILISREFDLYNQAFALFAYAQTSLACPEHSLRLEEKALRLLSALERYRHPQAGFEEGFPRTLPLCSNPHMHLFEAALAWEAATPSGNPIWAALADEIACLCLTCFVDPQTGALSEFFDGDWRPYPSRSESIVEPGHQFEWAWLLARWGNARGKRKALDAARRLFKLAITHGICPRRQAAVMQLAADFSILDDSCRLWPQTEWVKAALALAAVSHGFEKIHYWEEALRGIAALNRFLDDVPNRGLWRDRLMPDGLWSADGAPASTFYHVVCAILELDSTLKSLHNP